MNAMKKAPDTKQHLSAADRRLGMDVNISRRDFLNGVGVAIGACWFPSLTGAAEISAQDLPGYYPPSLAGMRGAHPGSFETAHSARDGATWQGESTGETYDLVVAGGGISGLAAAYFYQQAAGKNARILILDNHDDFGGHAIRNEFQIKDRQIIGYGGTMLLEAPGSYPDVARRLIKDLGIETRRFYKYFNQDLYSSLGLTRGLFLDKETFGADFLAVGDPVDLAVLEQSPLSEKSQGRPGALAER